MTEDDGYTTIHCSGVDMAQWKDPIQAARNEALEEAARVVDEVHVKLMTSLGRRPADYSSYASQAAASIRALKDTPEGDT